MEAAVKDALGLSSLTRFGSGGGGCISSGQGYDSDIGKVFVKSNEKDGAKLMFEGEFASLETIYETKTIRVPKPIKVIDRPKHGALFVMEYLELNSLHRHASQLGTQLANLHLHNSRLQEQQMKQESSLHKQGSILFVSKFGFNTTTCCGFIPQDNTWEETWPEFYARKLGQQISLLENKCGDREVIELWSHLQLKLSDFFKDLNIVPALLHGDLWSGNVAEIATGPVIFDPASFYGHHEFDLGITCLFGGFPSSFWKSYTSIIPKENGWSTRNELYQLFHNLNHWNHFGGGYRGASISMMKNLIKR